MELNIKSKQWSLNELYPGLGSKEFKYDFKAFEKKITGFKAWARDNLTKGGDIKSKLEGYISRCNEIYHYGMIYEYCELLQAVDSDNNDALKYSESFLELNTELTEPSTLFTEFIRDINDLDTFINSSEILKEHAFYLKEVKEQSVYVLSREEEAVIAKFKNTGSNYWGVLHTQVTSQLTADYEGKQVPISKIRNLAYDNNVEIRKKAYEAEVAAYKKIDKVCAACLNAIKGEALTESALRGYPSILDMTLINSRMEKTTLEAMFAAINEKLPVFRKYFAHKAKLLGDKNGLKYYNLFAPIGEAKFDFTYEKAASFIVENFTKFSPVLGNFAKNAFENNWLDIEPKEGKSGGAFCADIHRIKQSRVLSNFTENSFESMLTLAHELGHGFHNYCVNDETYINCNYTMPIAETASTFCETLVCSAALKNADKITKLSILENQISGAVQVIVDIYARFLFESEMIEERKNGSLSTEQLCELMVKAQKKSYGEGLEEAAINPYMWLIKSHYYDADNNFYNFPYAYGHLFSLGLYSKYLESPEGFDNKYMELLRATGKNSLEDVGKLCDIDVSKKDFWLTSLELIEKDIEEYTSIELVYSQLT